MRQGMKRLFTMIAAVCLGLGLLSIAGAAVAAQSTPVAGSPTATSYQAALQNGTCDNLGDTVADLGDLETTQPETGQGQLQGQVAAPPVLSTDKTIDASLDDLSSNPHAITIRRRDTTGTALLVCGPISGVANNGHLAIGLQPMTEQNVAGIVVLDQGQAGNGTHLSIYLLSVVAKGGGVGATPTT